jgi:glycine/D-amino acid oxidase-like deaminating enzyme
MRVIVVGAGLAGSLVSLELGMNGFQVVLVGSDEQLPWSTLIHSKLLRLGEDIAASHESLVVYAEISEYLGEELLIPVDSVTIARGELVNRLRDLVATWGNYGVRSSFIDCSDLGLGCLGDEVYVESRGGDHLVKVSRLLRGAREAVRFIRARARLVASGDEFHVEAGGETYRGDVVLCAGAWNSIILGELGLRAPLRPYACQAAAALVPRVVGRIIYDYSLGFYSRPLHPRLGAALGNFHVSLLAVGNGNTEACRGSLRGGFLADLGRRLRRRMGSAWILGSRCGLCEATPDMRPVLGRLVGNLYILGGLNGYGAEVGPGLARGLLKILRGEVPPDYVKPYLATRFMNGWPDSWEIGREPHELD